MDLKGLIDSIYADGGHDLIALNPLAQFGQKTRRYLGAEILPERLVDENYYREEYINFDTVIAADGSRYSSTQIQDSASVRTFEVALTDYDLARVLTGRDYDILIKHLMRNDEMEAFLSVANFINQVNLGLVEKAEMQRWEAICFNKISKINAQGDHMDAIVYPNRDINNTNVTGGTIAQPDGWYSANYDPFAVDIYPMADLLSSYGYKVARIITSRKLLSVLASNAQVQKRTARITVGDNGGISSLKRRASLELINQELLVEGLPPIELYDLRYRVNSFQTKSFIPENYMIFIGETGNDITINTESTTEFLGNTLGYYGLGRAGGQSRSGRVVKSFYQEQKPASIKVEGYATGLPVILHPNAIGIIQVNAPAIS